MTRSKAAQMLKRAAKSVTQGGKAAEEVSPAVEVAVTATEAVVEATEAPTPTPEPVVAATEVHEISDDDMVIVLEKEEAAKAPRPRLVTRPDDEPEVIDLMANPVPASVAQKWLVARLGLVRKDHELHSVKPLLIVQASEDDFQAKRDAVDARWPRAVCSAAITTLLNDEPFEHPAGFTVLPDHEAVAAYNARKAS